MLENKTMAVDFFVLGKRIQNKRKNVHLTQETVAEKLSVSVGYISQIERGITKVSLDTLSEIVGVLNCTISEILDGATVQSSSYLTDDLAEGILKLSPKNKKIILEITKILVNEQKESMPRQNH